MKQRFFKLFGAFLGAVFLLGSVGCANCWKDPYFGNVGTHKRYIPKEIRSENTGERY